MALVKILLLTAQNLNCKCLSHYIEIYFISPFGSGQTLNQLSSLLVVNSFERLNRRLQMDTLRFCYNYRVVTLISISKFV